MFREEIDYFDNKINNNLTCPSPFILLVNLTLVKATGFFIQWFPKLGESGWMYTELVVAGSGLPPATHSPFTYFQRWSSTATKSNNMEYIAFDSKPLMFNFNTGNIRLERK